MSPQNPQLLYFLALAAIPVLLHFLLRAKPKKLLFPALRLIQTKRRANRRRMRLRHLLLLLLRIAVIVLLVLALVRPTIPATDYMPSLSEIVTATVIIAVACGGYLAVTRLWQRREMPRHVLTQKKSTLRTGLVSATLLLLLLLVAWPFQRRIAAAITQPTAQQADKLPAAAVFLFDTGLSMDYRQENKTRLDRAREIATEHLSNLPRESRISVCDTSRNDPVRFSPDRSIAQAQIQELSTAAVALSLNDRLRAVVDLQVEDAARSRRLGSPDGGEGEDPFVRELYIFTDLALHAWQPESARLLQKDLERLPSLGVYLIDVGVENPVNVGVTDLRLSGQTISRGSEVMVEAILTASGSAAGEKSVEISIVGPNGELIERGSSEKLVAESAGTRVTFPLSGLVGPVVQGELRLVSSDPLPFDDVGYFTIEVQPPREVLIVSDDYVKKTRFWKQALSPDKLEERGESPYRCTVIDSKRFGNEDLSRFAVVCWLDVAAPEFSDWRALHRFVDTGGGAVIFLGSGVQHTAYVEDIAQQVLPAELLADRKFNEPEQLDLRDVTHPLLKVFHDWGEAELASVNFSRYWRTKPVKQAAVIVPYTDDSGSPAIVERAVGLGRVVLMTTPFDRSGWNNLVSFESYAVPVILADQMVQYVSQRADVRFNYTAGQIPVVMLPENLDVKQLLTRKPDRTQPVRDIPPGARELLIDDANLLGHYHVLPRDPKINFEQGFSINAASRESDLTRLTPDALDVLIGQGRYEAARDIDSLTRQVRQGRVGMEIFPWMVALMIAVFIAEHFVANYFYDTQSAAAVEAEEKRQPSIAESVA